mmetsp:Transcript_87536/g.283417  ORF Transcript_87536/g.283417 Transcript_87536/m.283417 type:complete len:404 (-) Transcript_87536:412-1623(-)
MEEGVRQPLQLHVQLPLSPSLVPGHLGYRTVSTAVVRAFREVSAARTRPALNARGAQGAGPSASDVEDGLWWLWATVVRGHAEAGLEVGPVEDSVVAVEHRLAQNEGLGAQGRQVHREQLRRAGTAVSLGPCAGRGRGCAEEGRGPHGRVHLRPVVLGQGQPAHVCIGVQPQRDAPELDLHDRRIHEAAVLDAARGPREQLAHCRRVRGREAEVRGAAVQDAEATATVADVQPLTADGHREDLNLPIAEFRLGHGHPGEWPRKAGRVVAAESDLALLPVVAFCQEDAKLGQPNPAASGEEVEEAEVLVQCQAVEPQAENPVKVEELKGSLRHLDGHHDVRLHAGPAWQRAASLFRGLRSGAQADLLACKLAGDQARAKADGHLVCSMASGHWQAVQVQGLGHL